MIYENEIIMLVLGLGVLVFAVANRDHLRQVPSFRVLMIGFCILVAAWGLTVSEEFFLEGTFGNSSLNFLEHLCYAMSGILIAFWCWLAFGRTEEGK